MPPPPAPQVLYNQIFGLMKGFNYLLLSTGGVRLLFPLFIFPAIYHSADSEGVCACAALPLCVRACVCVSVARECVKIFLQAVY